MRCTVYSAATANPIEKTKQKLSDWNASYAKQKTKLTGCVASLVQTIRTVTGLDYSEGRFDVLTPGERRMSKPIEPCHAMVGMRIRQIREVLGITQDDLAKRVGLKRVSVTNTEIGRQRLLLDGIERYAKALGTTPKALMKGIWW